jgi:hypothetical protein
MSLTKKVEEIRYTLVFGSAKAHRNLRLSELVVGWRLIKNEFKSARERGTSASQAPSWRRSLWRYEEYGHPVREANNEYLNKKINENLKCLQISLDVV